MPRLVDRKITADEADAFASPYIVSMNALFKNIEVEMMSTIEDMIAAGATEAEIIGAIEKMLA